MILYINPMFNTLQEINDLLDTPIAGTTFRQMSRVTFNQYVLNKLNGQPSHNVKVMQLTFGCNEVAFSRTMPDDEKIDKLKKLDELNIQIP
jgi:hypothetical protein